MNRNAWLAALLAVSFLAFGCDSEDGVDQGTDPEVDMGDTPDVDMGEADNTPPVLIQLSMEEDCSSLTAVVNALIDAGTIDGNLIAALNAQPGLTVFCPVNDAMDGALTALGIDLENLSEDDQNSLLGIIAYHIIPATLDAATLTSDAFPGAAGSLIGFQDGAPPRDGMLNTVRVYFDGEAEGVAIRNFNPLSGEVGVATVTEADVAVEGDETSIIHKIDAVLFPPGVAAVAIFEGLDGLVGAVTAAGDVAPGISLVAALSDPSAIYSVFAPTTDALNAALPLLGIEDLANLTDEQEAALRGVLAYHVATRSTRIFSTSLASLDTADTLANLTLVFDGTDINGGSGGTPPTGASIVGPTDIMAANGVIHVIDRVLLPLNVVQMAQAAGLTSLLDNVLAADAAAQEDDVIITAVLGDPEGTLTVFAPTDEAFAALDPAPTPDEARPVLLYHVVTSAVVASGDLSDGQRIATALEVPEAQQILFTADGTTFTDGAGNVRNAVTLDIAVTNGIIHVIDGVLLPGN